jgi:hypothetical protein
MYILTNMHNPPTNGKFCDDHGNDVKPRIVQDYNWHMWYVDKGNKMADSYTIQRWTWKWTKKLFFHLLDLTVVNSFLLLTSLGATMTRRQFRLALMQNLIEKSRSVCCPCRPMARPIVLEKQAIRLAVKFGNHWPVRSTRLYCHFCTTWRIKRRVQVNCKDCDVGLFVGECFETYHTISKAWCGKGAGNLRTSSQKRYIKKCLYRMFPARQSRVIPRGPAYGLPRQEQV